MFNKVEKRKGIIVYHIQKAELAKCSKEIKTRDFEMRAFETESYGTSKFVVQEILLGPRMALRSNISD